MTNYSAPMTTGGPGGNFGAAGYYIPGGRVPTSVEDALGQYASSVPTVRPNFPTSDAIFDGTSYVGEEAYTSEYTDMVTQPGKRLDQTAKPLTYLAKRDPAIGLSDQWVSGMPMFSISPADIDGSGIVRVINVQPQYRGVSMASAPQINKILLEHYRRTRRRMQANIHEDATRSETDKIVEHEKWKDTARGHGKFLHYAGILLGKQDNSENNTYVEVTKQQRIAVPNFWGEQVEANHKVGFILKRMSTATESGPFQLVPWSSSSNMAPTKRELRYINILPNGSRQICHGTSYVVGEVLHTPTVMRAPSLANDRISPVNKNLQLQMIGATTSSTHSVTPDGSDSAVYAATVVKDVVTKIDIEPSIVPWMRAFA